jgi:hypothetical protein
MARKYLSFDGSTGYVTVPNNAALNFGTGDFSICFWAKFQAGNADCNILWKDAFAGRPGYVFGFESDDVLSFLAINAAEEYIYAPFSTAPYDNTFRFYAVVKNSTTVKSYINGSLDTNGTSTNFGLDSDNAANLIIAEDDYAATSFFEGSLDDLRFYKKSLSEAEVLTIYNSGKGKKYSADDAGAASAAWNMDEGTGTTITDEVGSLEGTFTGGVTWEDGGVPFLSGNTASETNNEETILLL